MKKVFAFHLLILTCFTLSLRAADKQAPSPEEISRVTCVPVKSLDASENVAPLVMNNMSVRQAMELLQRLSGRTLLLGADIPDVRLNFNSGAKITRIDAIFALESLLSMNGVQLIKTDDQFVRAVPSRGVTREGPALLGELDHTITSGQVYSRIFTLEYLTATEGSRLISPLLSGGRGQSAVITLVRNNSLLVIDTLNKLQFIEKVLKDADTPGERRVEVYSISLAHTPVLSAFRFMTQLQRTSHKDVFGGTTFYQDARTNQLIVSTNPAHIDLIRKILEEFDQDATPLTSSKIFEIQHGNVATIYSILNNIINNQRRIWNQQGFLQSDARREVHENPGVQPATGSDKNEEELEGPVVAATQDVLEESTSLMMGEGMPQLQFSPYLSIFIDRSSSQIVAYGTAKDLERVEKLIQSLDKKSAPFTLSELVYLKYADSADISRTLNALINRQRSVFRSEGVDTPVRRASDSGMQEEETFSPFLSVLADRRSNALLLYGTQGDIERVRFLISQLDKKTAPLTESRLFHFKYADASTASNMIARVINNQRSTFGREGIQDTERRQQEEGGAQEGPGNLVFSSFVTLMPDRRSNALLVYGTSQDLLRVEELIADIDIEAAPFTQSQVVYLKHSQASTVGGILNNLINQQRRTFGQQGLRSGAEQDRAKEEQQGPLVKDEMGTEFSPFASVVVDQRINALLLYGTGGDLQSLGSIVKSMDIPVDPLTKSEVFQLQYAQATNLVSILNTIIRGQQQALRRVASTSREIRVPGADTREDLLTNGIEPMQFSPYITLVADRRSNTILGYGTDEDLIQIRELIAKTDIEVAPITRSRVFEIQHGEADQVVQTLRTLITSQQRVREQESTLRRVFSRNGEDGAVAEGNEMPMDPLATQQALANIIDSGEGFQFSPYISLVADIRSNSVVAYGTSFDLEQVSDLISRIDVILPQVRIEVVIAEVALTGDMVSGLSAFGFNYKQPFNPESPGIGDLGFKMDAPAFDGENQKAFSTSFTLDKFSLSSVFNVAKRDRNVRVLSAPTIVTTHNRQAQINVGQAFPIVTSTITGAGSGNDLTSRATVEYRDIGIELRVKPLIGTGSTIQMEIEQVVDTVVGTQTISENVQPIIGTRRASSFISVKDQDVIVLGGLQSVDTTEVKEKVFLLGDLPLLGGLFRPKTDKQDVRELIIFIKPYIVESGDGMKRVGKEELEKTAVGKEIEYFLREGRFQEQEKLKEINEERNKKLWPATSSPEASPQRVWTLPPVKESQVQPPEEGEEGGSEGLESPSDKLENTLKEPMMRESLEEREAELEQIKPLNEVELPKQKTTKQKMKGTDESK